MRVHFNRGGAKVVHGDSLDVLKRLPENSIHAVVTDPPYGLSNTDPKHVIDALTKWTSGDRAFVPEVRGGGFMGKHWDSFVPPPALWDEVFRVLKPGGYLLCFAGTRTFDLMGMSIRLSGFELRDTIEWIYGSGFPKSMDVSKAIDKADRGFPQGGSDPTSANHGRYKTQLTEGKRGVSDRGQGYGAGASTFLAEGDHVSIDRVLTENAQTWAGWGTALKPAHEPILVCQKPFKGTVAKNVVTHGTGALNVDASRIGTGEESQGVRIGEDSADRRYTDEGSTNFAATPGPRGGAPTGRFPANLILQHLNECSSGECVSTCPAVEMDQQSGPRKAGGKVRGTEPSKTGDNGIYSSYGRVENAPFSDSGGASRFFYQAKATKKERPSYVAEDGSTVTHPTVKPLELIRYLVRMVTSPGGIVLDPFPGSGTTLEAAVLEGFRTIGIELEAEFLPLIDQRLERSMEKIG